MADETSVGGIVAPVRADITDFMSKFNAVNEKTNIVSNNIVAKLDEINKAMQNLNSQSVGANISKHDKSVDETASRYKSLRQEVNQASVEMEKAWRGSGASFDSAKKNYEDALNKLVAFKKESGTISIGQESGIYSSMARGVGKTSASYDVLINRIKDLKNEQKEFGNITSIATPKASQPVISNIAEMIKASQITDSIKEAKYQIAAIDRNLFEELRKNNQNETIRTGELRRQKSELEGQLNALKSQKEQKAPDQTKDIALRERNLQEEQKIRRAISDNAIKTQNEVSALRERNLQEEQKIRRAISDNAIKTQNEVSALRERNLQEEQKIRRAIDANIAKSQASELARIDAINTLKGKENAQTDKQRYKDEESARIKSSNDIKSQMIERQKQQDLVDKAQRIQIGQIDTMVNKYDTLNNKVKDYYTSGTKMSERQFLGWQRQIEIMENKLSILSPNSLNPTSLTAFSNYKQYEQMINNSAKIQENNANKLAIQEQNAQNAKLRNLDTVSARYDALNNKVRNYQENDRQMSRVQFSNIQEQAKLYENIMTFNNRRNSTGPSPLLGQNYEEYYRARVGLDALTAAQEKYGMAVGGNNKVLSQFKGHITWMAGAVAIGAILAIPIDTVTRLKEIEQGMAGVKQVLPTLEHDQKASNKEAKEFIKIASEYGESVDKVIDAGRSWGRMYKDVDTVNLLVSQSAKMAVADNFDMGLSVKGLESAMAQFGMKTENYNEIMLNSSRILDVWTKLAHTGAASAQDLTAATERAGASANQMGVSFEFFNALVSTGVRNTALSGENIGNSLKSMFNSIHSKKAISEIENLGVAIYKVNADGTKSFRDTQSVILDLALAIKSTNKDTSALELALGGGKFQVSKITSIMTDYKEIIKMWENAVNSAGFTDQQVGVQMDTLARKSKTMKAEMDNVFSSAGDSGLTKNLKDMTESMTNFIRGMNQGAESMTFLVKWSVLAGVPLYALAKALQGVAYYNGFVEMSTTKATGATAQAMVADIEATVAKNGLSAALLNQSRAAGMVAATTGTVTRSTAMVTAATMGWVGIAIVLAGVIYNVVTAIGENSRAIEKNADTIDKRQEKAVGQLAKSREQAEFITTLSGRYVSLGAEIDKNSGSTEENTKKIEQQNVILAALSRQSGLTTDELVVNGVLQVETIENATKAKKQQAKDSIQADIDKTVADINSTNVAIENTQARIDVMKAEMHDVGLLGKAYQWLMSIIAQRNLAEADRIEAESNKPVATGKNSYNGFLGVDSQEIHESHTSQADLKLEAVNLRAKGNKQLEESGQAGIGVLTSQVENARSKVATQMTGLSKLQESLVAMDKEIEKSDGIISEGKDKNKAGKKTPAEPGAGIKTPDNRMQQFNDKALSRSVNEMFDEAKIKADKYSMALDIINAKESLMGVSADSSKQRQILMKEQVNDLLATAMEYSGLATDYEKQANDMVASNEAMVESLDEQKVSWANLSKEQKLAFIELNKDYIKDINSMNNLIDLADKLKVKSADISKQASNVSLNALQKSISDAKTIYDNKISIIDLNRQSKELDLGNHYTKEQLDTIELSSAIDKLREAKQRLEDLENSPGGKDSMEYNQQLVAVKQLTNQVGILSDKTVVVNTNMANMFIGMKNKTTSFKDFWKNAWSDMADEAIRNIWNVNNAGSQTSFLGGLVGSIFGSGVNLSGNRPAGISGPTGSNGGFFKNVDGVRENGGDVEAGKTYLVGEKRPELFTPKSNGSIIPDLSALRSGSSSSSNMGNGNVATEISVNVEQNFQGKQDASVLAQIKESIPYIKAEIRNSMANEQSMRSAVKGAAIG